MASSARHYPAETPGFDEECDHLRAVFSLAGCAGESPILARALLVESGSLGAAFTLSRSRLGKLGIPEPAIRALAIVRAAQVASLRRETEGRIAVGGHQALLDYLHVAMAHLPVEEFRVLFLDLHNGLIRNEIMSRGTVDSCPAHVREIIARALELSASGLVLVHNHPSGSLKPSSDDIFITNAVAAVAAPLGIKLHEHLIITRTGHASLRSLGLI